ncbi:MAG: ATP-binding cassette domain-containing protein [Gluconobacter sp.]
MASPDNLVFENVTLCAGQTRVLNQVSLTVPLEGITLLSGRNGAGKSTVLRACLDLVRPEKGQILIDGLPPGMACERIGYMPQGLSDAALMIPAISHVMAAMDGARWGVPVRFGQRKREAERLLALTGALSFSKRPLGHLSGGERQRVCLAQALAGQPGLLLLDEPLAALDHDAQQQIVALLVSLTQSLGVSILMTSHETAALDRNVTRVLVLENGELHVRI